MSITENTPLAYATWVENEQEHKALWIPQNDAPPPARIVMADDTLNADEAYRLASQGTYLLWRGDFQNARQLLQALARRVDKKRDKRKKKNDPQDAGISGVDAFNRHRLQQAQRSNLLNRLLIELDADAGVALRRAPDVRDACMAALGKLDDGFLLSLRALQGIIGAHEWRKKGVEIPGLSTRIHVHYGVFSPNRGEYIKLLQQAPLPTSDLAFDIGTGSGVLAAVLAQRGVRKIIATDQDPRALDCARENIERLGLGRVIQLQETDLFPEGKSALIVCNPPWVPARPTTAVEHAIYDPGNRMLLGFLNGLAGHLLPHGEGWLVMSDLAEHLGLRSPDFLPDAIAAAGLKVVGKLDARPEHPKTMDESDPLHAARRAELTSLWRLALAGPGLN